MARTKTTPVKSDQKQRKERKSLREKRKWEFQSSPSSSKRSLRLSSQESRKRSVNKRNSKGKGAQKSTSNANLPPELRQAGLLAHQSMAKGKCFGPFRGKIINKKRPPSDQYSLVCKVSGVDSPSYYFYAHKDEQDKCMWLQRMQSASDAEEQNIVAHNSAAGVSYEATRNITVGEELLVMFDESYGGTKYPAYVENIPVQFVPNSGKGQLKVVPLEYKSKQGLAVPTQDDKGASDDEGVDQEDTPDASDQSESSRSSEQDAEEQGDSPSDNESAQGDESEAESEEADDLEVEDDPVMDADYSANDKKPVKSKTKKLIDKKVQDLKVLVIECKDKKGNTETTKYQCSYCAIESDTQEVVERHVAAQECLSLVFLCSTGCGRVFRSKQNQTKHMCTGKPKCSVCDEDMADWNELMAHFRAQRNNAQHKYRCKHCDSDFANKKEKRQHLRTTHQPPQEPLTCPICQKVYKNKAYYHEHLKTHEPDAFKCPVCEKKYSSSTNLNKHVRKHKPDYKPPKDSRSYQTRTRKHECMECHKMFDSPHALQIHSHSHTGERPYQCDMCEWKFSQRAHLARHKRTVHREAVLESDPDAANRPLPPADQPKTCEICQKVYAGARVLKVHVRTVHQKERPHKCSHCEQTFTQRGHLWRHKHTVHPDCEEVQKKINSGEHTCSAEGCGKRFPCRSDLNAHMSSKHDMAWPHECSQCRMTFPSRGNLNKHIRRRHTGTHNPDNNTCGTCYQAFESYLELTEHRKTHAGAKGFRCELCGHGFVQRSGLNKHLRCRRCPGIAGSAVKISHKKYECEVCKRMFAGPSDLKAHGRTHTGERPFACPVCQKGFTQPGNLSKHVRYVHEKQQRPKEKPRDKKYFCSLCGKAFLCPSSLSMHCRTHSGTKPFACALCDATFVQQGNLKKHTNIWHNPDNPTKRVMRKRNAKKGDGAGRARAKRQKKGSASQQAAEQQEHESHESEAEDASSDEDEATEACDQTEQQVPPVAQALVPVTTALAAHVTSALAAQVTSALEAYVNPRSCTPLNSATQGHHFTPLNTAIPAVSPSQQRAPIIMTHIVNAGAPPHTQQVPLVHATQSAAQTQTQAPLYLPASYGAITSPQVRPHATHAQMGHDSNHRAVGDVTQGASAAEITSACTSIAASASANSSVILPHMHTLFAQQMSHAPFMSPTVLMGHGTQPDMTIFPFSPSTLFQQ